MDYFDRLLLRTRAQPRDAPEPLFDPFAQTAPWPLEAPARGADAVRGLADAGGSLYPPTPPGVPAGAARDGAVAGRHSTGAADAAFAPLAAHPPPAGSAAEDAPLASAPRPSRAPATPAASGTAMPAMAAEQAALGHADAFIRTLGIPGLLAPDIPPPAPPAPRHAVPRGPAAPAAARPGGRAVPPVTPLLRPAATPTPPERPRAPPAARPDPRPLAASNPAPAAARAPATPPPIVETTVIVAPPSAVRRLDDMAHGAAIARFGLGQT